MVIIVVNPKAVPVNINTNLILRNNSIHLILEKCISACNGLHQEVSSLDEYLQILRENILDERVSDSALSQRILTESILLEELSGRIDYHLGVVKSQINTYKKINPEIEEFILF